MVSAITIVYETNIEWQKECLLLLTLVVSLFDLNRIYFILQKP